MGFFDKLFSSKKTEQDVPKKQTAEPAPKPAPKAEPAEAPKASEEPSEFEVMFGGKQTAAYPVEVDGEMAVVYVQFIGKAKMRVLDADEVRARGGAESIKEGIRLNLTSAFAECLFDLGKAKVPVNRLNTYALQITENIKSRLSDDIKSYFGVEIAFLSVDSLRLTDKSFEDYKKLMEVHKGGNN